MLQERQVSARMRTGNLTVWSIARGGAAARCLHLLAAASHKRREWVHMVAGNNPEWAITIAATSSNFIGDDLRDALDVRNDDI